MHFAPAKPTGSALTGSSQLTSPSIAAGGGGRRAEAVPVSQEAVDLYGELTGLNRDAHLPGLAASLNNHAILLAQMGRRAEAVPVSQEAVDLRRELAGLNRDAHLPDYVQSVTALGYVLVAGTCPGEATGAPSRGVHAASSCRA